MEFVDLPADVLALVFQYLSVQDLVILARTCKGSNILVAELGWSAYLRGNPRPSSSLARTRTHWPPKVQARYNVLTDQAWSRAEFIARPLSQKWATKSHPLLAIDSSSLFVAAGTDIHKFDFRSRDGSPSIDAGGTFNVPSESAWLKDITSLVRSEQEDDTLFVGLHDRTLRKVSLGGPKNEQLPGQKQPVALNQILSRLPENDFLESLNISRNNLLSLSSEGRANLLSTSLLASPLDSLEINARCWTSHLCLDALTPYAAFGTSSARPLRVHLFTESKILPTASIHPFVNTSLSEYHSAVYSFSRPPLASPWGSSPQILISGWFDGQARCYDLRSSSRVASSGSSLTDIPILRPVLSMRDPSLEAIYSVSSGGGSASYIAAGSARYSVVSFWDVRNPTTGWSVHAPKNDRSPVYSVILESSRLFGATESRPFIYDFGPDVSAGMYPPLRRKSETEEIGYNVTKFAHGGGLFSANEA